MSLYEGMFVLDNRQANRDWDGSLEKLKGIVEKHGAEMVRCEKWGERKLSYEINRRRRATYVLAHFQAEGQAVNRIYRECELSELILRALILKRKALPSEEETRRLAEASVARLRRTSRRPVEERKVARSVEKKEVVAVQEKAAAESPSDEEKSGAEQQKAPEPQSGQDSGG